MPTDRIPTLAEVSERVAPLPGFRYVPAPGLVPLREFYGSLSERVFHSTRYVRHPGQPLYTPEPDIIHEVIGHGHLLATPTFSELHRLTGEATNRLTDEGRSEEHTSELQSRQYLVCRLLLEKKTSSSTPPSSTIQNSRH